MQNLAESLHKSVDYCFCTFRCVLRALLAVHVHLWGSPLLPRILPRPVHTAGGPQVLEHRANIQRYVHTSPRFIQSFLPEIMLCSKNTRKILFSCFDIIFCAAGNILKNIQLAVFGEALIGAKISIY